MKCHTGVDAGSGFVHTVEVTSANAHDVTMASRLIREDDEVIYGDSAYLGMENRVDAAHRPIDYRIVKQIFGYRKVVYRGLSKNLNRLYLLFASTNLPLSNASDRSVEARIQTTEIGCPTDKK